MDLVGHLSKELGGLRLNLTPGKVPLNHHLLLRVRSWDLCLIVDEVDAGAYLIFVIFLHEQNFWRIKFTPKKRVNYGKIHSNLPIFCVITAK